MTDIILNQLYPGGVMKQLADAAGGVVYDQYAAGGCVGQLYAAADADVVLDQYAAGGPLHQIELEIEEGGGGSGLDWVPENAVIHIDLVGGEPQGRAWTAADGIVAVDTLLGSDANTESGWGVSGYDAESLVEYGYSPQTAGFPLAPIGVFRTALMAGSTLTYKTRAINSPFEGFTSFALLSADGNDAIETGIAELTDVYAMSWNGPLDVRLEDIVNDGVDGATNVQAFTIVDARLDLAVNGSTAETSALDELDRPPANPYVAAIFDCHADLVFQSITLYDALPSTAGLSELSVTDTNTAPTNLRADSWSGFVGDTGDTAGTITEGDLVGMSPENRSSLCDLIADDAEGNPLTYSLTEDEGEAFVIDGIGLQIQATLSANTYNPVVRATDPGGLYVEQEFTITVTA